MTTIQPPALARLIEQYGAICVWCGGDHAHRALTLEHVCPRSRGGVSAKENLLPSCRACHRARRSAPARQFARQQAEQGLQPRADLLEETLKALGQSSRRSHREYGLAQLKSAG